MMTFVRPRLDGFDQTAVYTIYQFPPPQPDLPLGVAYDPANVPRDPGDEGYVALCWRAGDAFPCPLAIHGNTVDDVRDTLPAGLVCIDRAYDDDPLIVESWL